MIHDASVEATCDGGGCRESVCIPLEWVYRSQAPSSGFYDADDAKIEETLADRHDWIVGDGKHFCSPECKSR